MSAWERINTENGILAVANFVSGGGSSPKPLTRMSGYISGYEVYLPSGGIEPWAAGYAGFLLKNPHPNVRVKFSASDLNG